MNSFSPDLYSALHWFPFQKKQSSGSLFLLSKQHLGVRCLREVTAFLNHFSIQRVEPSCITAATTYQLQTFQLLLLLDDIQPWDPVHLQSMRVSGYCIFSIDVPNDMAITDAGHESKALNHPARWSVQQVLLSDLLWIHNMKALHRNILKSHAGSSPLVPAVCYFLSIWCRSIS